MNPTIRIPFHLLAKLGFPALICVFALGYRSTIEAAPRAARLFPDALVWLLLLLCAAEIARAVHQQLRHGAIEAPGVDLGGRQLLVLVAMGAFYPLVLLLGFATPSVIFLFSVSILCGAALRQAAILTVSASVGLYLFVRLSGFELPLF
jgi:hypothetical protein